MARRNGWQLPAHSTQVVAIATFCLLSIAFYIFFAPFIGKGVYEYVALAVYSVLVFFVIILYVRCAAIDPADPGILISNGGPIYKSKKDNVFLEDPSNVGLRTEEHSKRHKTTTCTEVGCFICNLMVKDDCCYDDNFVQNPENSGEKSFCTLCNREVYKLTKHCRSCDKCIDGFDHHCRWLNNCIGRKNYITFFLLMATSIAWLVAECGFGIAVFVRCVMHNSTIKMQIHDRLGFSIIPLAIIVGICTAFSFIALIPLGELFFFHVILIRKGITTYEYLLAMQMESDPPGPSINEDPQTPLTSPLSSVATAISGNSIGLQHRGAWCTPPRIFMDNQNEVMPPLDQGRVPSITDPDSFNPPGSGKRQSKKHVRINPWRLVKLDSGEASKAAAKARATSSVLKPISSRPNYDCDHLSPGNTSAGTQAGTMKSSPSKSPCPPSQGSMEDPEALSSQISSNQSPLAITTSPVVESIKDRLRSSNSRSSVYWNQEAGRFMSSENTSGSATSRADVLYSGNSIFYGGPVLTGGSQRRGNEQLPIFAPRDPAPP